jgi:hypothetical protein
MIGFNQMFPVVLIAVVAFTLTIAVPELWAGGYGYKPKVEELEVAELYFELNNTDGDLGIHGKIDGGPWTKVWVEDPYRRRIMKVSAKGRLRAQAVTELFFESAEPTFDELDPEDFFKRFPEGIYKIKGIAQGGKRLAGQSEISHVMPAPPDDIDVSGAEINLGTVDCDKPPIVVPEDNGDVIISWAPVELSHDEIGKPEVEIEVARYQLVVEIEVDLNGDEFEAVYSVDMPPSDEPSMAVPAAFINLGIDEGEGEYKFEILVKEADGGNQTATESCFAIVIGEEDD